jgi:hypothetical protein
VEDLGSLKGRAARVRRLFPKLTWSIPVLTSSAPFEQYGEIVDEPRVGKELTEAYWQPGNGEAFLDLVANLTGKPLTGDAWVAMLQVRNPSYPTLLTGERRSWTRLVSSRASRFFTDAKVADRNAKVWHGATENVP